MKCISVNRRNEAEKEATASDSNIDYNWHVYDILRMLECWNVGMLECWNVGMLECWNVGMLECWNVRVGML
jgi:hypothetical protein